MFKKLYFPFILIIFFTFLNGLTIAEETFPLKEEVVVTGSLIPTEFSKLARKVTIIKKEEIAKAPVNSISDLLKYVLSLDLRQRGPFGVQADISIRGSNFSQVLILINGIKVYDPQTAHHNLDIPVSLSNIERIEILNGQGSSIYGENAFGGVINIVTKKSPLKKISGGFLIGEYKTLFGNLSFSHSINKINHTIAVDYQGSDGFEFDRDFNIFNLLSNSQIDFSQGKINLLIGFNKKNFGANNFYASFPSKEWTKTKFISLNSDIRKTKIKLYYRQHYDKFMLDITQPDWYVNEHTTQSYGTEVYSFFDLNSLGKIVFGGEVREDEIKSSNLGSHSYYKFSLFSEYETILLNKLYLDAGLRGDYYSNYGLEFSPNFSLSYLFSSQLKIRSSFGQAFRIPSFTELYYHSPANTGNPDLKPEKNFSFEMGIDYFPQNLVKWETTFFLRKDKNLIDWIKEKKELPWRAENIQRINFYGIETKLKFKDVFSFGYTYLKSSLKQPINFISKYVLNHPVHQISSSLNLALPLKINSGVYGVYKRRKGEKGYLILDVKISKRFNRWEFFIQATNLLNTQYQEILGVSMPNRWVMTGVRFGI
ncbi:MAG: TonB-dependent receptor plug domain-containing protein [Candidatus Aminicenantia bacterium]